ncbi:MAG TPA: hypothetical protein VH478_10955 [Trebonia sp.]|jgi:hypothetical protein|nr:hypothetical protein [Trebonia sp.]
MTTVLFLHGTGVRGQKFTKSFQQVKAGLEDVRDDLAVESCYWGEIGARLWAGGVSFGREVTAGRPSPGPGDPVDIDAFDNEAANAARPVTEAELDLAHWAQMMVDPLFEVRLRQVRASPAQEDEAEQTSEGLFEPPASPAKRVAALAENRDLVAALAGNGVPEQRFRATLKAITESDEFDEVFQDLPALTGGDEVMLARAIVAHCLSALAAEGVEVAGQRRDELWGMVKAGFGVPDYAVPDDLLRLGKNIAWPVSWALGKTRGAIIRQLGDILLYQAQGDGIRRMVRARIAALSRSKGPVVLLAHSLGGIIAFDVLAADGVTPEEKATLDRVKMLVTVGTQVPLLHELRALASHVGHPGAPPLSFTQPWLNVGDDTKRPWLNVYDEHDLLGYAGANLFGGHCRDIILNTKQPFPFAHGAYWDPKAGLYTLLADELRKAGL